MPDGLDDVPCFSDGRPMMVDWNGNGISLREYSRGFADLLHKWVRKTYLFDLAREDRPSAEVSTVFLGIDHNFGMSTHQQLFETMVFSEHDNYLSDYCERYPTVESAQLGHEEIVHEVAFKMTRPEVVELWPFTRVALPEGDDVQEAVRDVSQCAERALQELGQ